MQQSIMKSSILRCINIKLQSKSIVTLINYQSDIYCKYSKIEKSFPKQIIIRHFGIADSIMGFANKKMEQTKENQFEKMIQLMIQSPSWTLKDWKATLESQLNSWITYIPGIGSSAEVTQVKLFKAMLDVMTPLELEKPETINGAAKDRIARSANTPIENVVKLLLMYRQTLVVYTWLQLKKKEGEKLPKSELELTTMQETDIRLQTIVRKITQPNKAKSGRGRSLPSF